MKDMEVKKPQDNYFLPHSKIQACIDYLTGIGHCCVGPQIRDGAIVYETLHNAQQLPWGIQEHQVPGSYQLQTTGQKKAFLWANGPQAIKPILFPASEPLWSAIWKNGQIQFIPAEVEEDPIAIFGVRACDVAGMKVQDKVFLGQKTIDPRYQSRREKLFLIGVNCSYSSDNCFCVSAGTGPEIQEGCDIVLTEVENGFLLKVGTKAGDAMVKSLALPPAQQLIVEESKQVIDATIQMQTKRIPHDNQKTLRDSLMDNLDHPRWEEVAERCLSCGNCTQVCPTCFCHSEFETPSLDGDSSTHQRQWDSCFTQGHSYLAVNFVIRDDTSKRYRQWLTHKVATWFDQFDMSGCVGCGRCITWCPVGIDLTEELAAMTGESNRISA
jgi:ferredoxin